MSTATVSRRESLIAAAPMFETPEVSAGAARLRRAAIASGDVLLLGGIMLSIPFVILAIGIPIALFVRLLLWIVRLV